MRLTVLISLIVWSGATFGARLSSADDQPINFNPGTYPVTTPSVDLSRFDPETRRIIREEAVTAEQVERALASLRYFVSERTGEGWTTPVRVFGLTEREAMYQSADPYQVDGEIGGVCEHEHGDLANRWCHAYFVKMADTYLRSRGFGKNVAALLSTSIMVFKEYNIDHRPSPSDMVMAEYEVFHRQDSDGRQTRVTLTVFGDGAAFVTLDRSFK